MHYITLKDKDLEILIEISGLIIEYKEIALSKLSWHRFEVNYLPSLLQSLKHNMFKHVRSDDNLALWILDQICHSRKIIPGVKHSEGIPLIDTPLGEEAAQILRAMSRGQIAYDEFRRENNFHSLFEIDK
jgi:hypothetical protein